MDMTDVISAVEAGNTAVGELKKNLVADMDEQKKRLLALETKANRPNLFGSGSPIVETKSAETWIDAKTQRPIQVLEHKHSLAALEPKLENVNVPSMGRLLRGMVLGGRAHDAKELEEERKSLGFSDNTAGGFTVPAQLSAQWIDLLRARMVLSQAGVRTVPMDSKTLTMARVTGDPVTLWHPENAALTAGDPTFGAVTLDAEDVRLHRQVVAGTLAGQCQYRLDTADDHHAIDGACNRQRGPCRRDDQCAGRARRHFQPDRPQEGDVDRRTDQLGLPGRRHLYTLQASNVPLESTSARSSPIPRYGRSCGS